MRSRLGMIFSIPPTLATLLVAAMIGAGTWGGNWLATPRPHPQPDSAVYTQLDRSIPAMRLQDEPWSIALDQIRQYSGLDIRLTPRVQSGPIPLDLPLSMRLRNVKAKKALRVVLEAVSGGANAELIYAVDDHGVLIMLREEELENAVDATFWVGGFIVSQGVSVDSESMHQIESLIATTISVGTWESPRAKLSSDTQHGLLHIRHSPETVREVRVLMGRLLNLTRVVPLQSRAGMP
jgi:hypothetical protein